MTTEKPDPAALIERMIDAAMTKRSLVERDMKTADEWAPDTKAAFLEYDAANQALLSALQPQPGADDAAVLEKQFRRAWTPNDTDAEEVLKAVLARMSGPQWRDIDEQTPERCIVAVKARSGAWLVGEARRNEDTGHWWWANEDAGMYHAEEIHLTHNDPSYWQPLPAAPTEVK